MPNPDPVPGLVRAAQALEEELRHCEDAVAEAARIRLNSEKNIGRAARALQKADEHRNATGARVTSLQSAILEAHGRAEAATSRMAARAAELQARLERLQGLRTRSDDIAAAVHEVGEFAKGAKDRREILERLGPVEDRVAAAQQDARREDFDDVAHEMAGLREMIAQLRRKLEK